KFTIIQRDNTTIACAALYPFPEEKIGEMACVAVHPDYRSSSRGEVLLNRIATQAKHKFTIIQRDNTTIACAALYPFPEEKIGEMACVAVHPDYRSSSRGEVLLNRIATQAKQMGLSKLFVLTTRSIHWFQERGFTPVDIDLLPESKKEMYNYQRRSKVMMADLG
ncbi:hypothetical protein UA70_30285, partial [Raoultella planticola]